RRLMARTVAGRGPRWAAGPFEPSPPLAHAAVPCPRAGDLAATQVHARRAPPDRVGTRRGTFHGAPGAPPPRRAAARRHRPTDPGGGALRTGTTRRARARGHQEAGPGPSGWRTDDARP